jgi:hypothetical protein
MVVDSVDLEGGSTLALAALAQGAPVPRNVRIRRFRRPSCARFRSQRDSGTLPPRTGLRSVDPDGATVALVIRR